MQSHKDFPWKGRYKLKNSLIEAIELVESGQAEEGLKKLSGLEKTLHDEEKFLLAEKYYQWGNTEQALSIMEDMHTLYPEESEVTVFLAEVYIDMDEEEKAIELLSTIPETDPAYVQALILSADLYQMQGLNEVSEQKLLSAKKIVPDEPVIDFALGELYFHQGHYHKAIPYFKDVLKEHKVLTGVNVYQRLAESISASGEFEEAIPYYEKAVDEQVDLHTLFGYGFTALQANYPKTAIDQFLKLKELDHEYTSLYLYLAKAYEAEGMLAESLETVKDGLKADEYNKELYVYGGKIALKNNEPNEASALLQQAIAIDPGHVEATITLTNIYMQEQKYEEVIDCLKEVMRYGEEDPEYDRKLARAYHQTEQYSDALNHYQRAYNFFKEEPDFLTEYGYYLLEDGNRAAAREMFRQALKHDPANVEIEEILIQLEDDF
ncbi:tetratricopeptide repeat protein [Peribacillus frigoritolerans]|uniref:tetratricopeptide repeat protein n=1 Tax=Peribacillus frigoritolerans TaxID=450367 RepID=UPI00105927A3|nr:tetratricopeptide repeat protein [Peribacillus frigoritolerans]TDL83406.1 tetratricopeptide repeat protein [Peribacillus frigoritolerans]